MRARALCVSLMLLASGAGCRRESAGPSSPRPGPEPVSASAAAVPVNEGDAGPAGRPIFPIPDLGYNAREGRALYRHYCATCHGEAGRGDGFNAYNLDPKPRDLAAPAFQAKTSDDDLVAIIRSGGGVAGLSTAMPPWGRTLNDRKIRNIVDFLRSLPQEPE